jgi:hypothetical protein
MALGKPLDMTKIIPKGSLSNPFSVVQKVSRYVRNTYLSAEGEGKIQETKLSANRRQRKSR